MATIDTNFLQTAEVCPNCSCAYYDVIVWPMVQCLRCQKQFMVKCVICTDEPHKPRRGMLALCGLGHLGVITSDKPEPITYADGNTSEAWLGVHILPLELVGKPWSSRHPKVICSADHMQYAVDQYELCCETFGVRKGSTESGDTLLERMCRWKQLIKKLSEQKKVAEAYAKALEQGQITLLRRIQELEGG